MKRVHVHCKNCNFLGELSFDNQKEVTIQKASPIAVTAMSLKKNRNMKYEDIQRNTK